MQKRTDKAKRSKISVVLSSVDEYLLIFLLFWDCFSLWPWKVLPKYSRKLLPVSFKRAQLSFSLSLISRIGFCILTMTHRFSEDQLVFITQNSSLFTLYKAEVISKNPSHVRNINQCRKVHKPKKVWTLMILLFIHAIKNKKAQ